MQLSLSHLGYLPHSPKILTLVPEGKEDLPERIPFYLRQNCLRMNRDRPPDPDFSARFPSPYNLLRGKLTLRDIAHPPLYSGELERHATRWGTLWQADFSAFTTPGSYQIETDWQISLPFAIRDRIYDRIIAWMMAFLIATDRPGLSPVAGMMPVTSANGSPSLFSISTHSPSCMIQFATHSNAVVFHQTPCLKRSSGATVFSTR
jgi:hypothetical protein